MTGRFEHIVAEHRDAVERRLENLRRLREPRELAAGATRGPAPAVEEEFYRPSSWLI
ncbi:MULTISPECIES: hypothetical protein [Rhodococcus]|uniref:Uncharacterized protein n=1 Tax=Rhodococcus aetherivorans TaxID=191292 RepID=N1M2G0_9NOCA|nr:MULTISPECIES: hypothetical protein [Rhodococcus]ETT23507.1 hypothetical protein RR21198_5388 [Rhodococcus rhodochrous ATCC 21198]NCL76163.1 hypothetical protein [Rhodococcus sp. YH1]MBC2588469.1 hypothetical protein [Rhodococcus aetherivorans]MDV6296617.1 hypothetical protein [Rhodococcus aetherivorans]NGP30022.1 hypothetical protein [Rhodococcus aetherivorans]